MLKKRESRDILGKFRTMCLLHCFGLNCEIVIFHLCYWLKCLLMSTLWLYMLITMLLVFFLFAVTDRKRNIRPPRYLIRIAHGWSMQFMRKPKISRIYFNQNVSIYNLRAHPLQSRLKRLRSRRADVLRWLFYTSTKMRQRTLWFFSIVLPDWYQDSFFLHSTKKNWTW